MTYKAHSFAIALAILVAGCARKPAIAPITPDTTILAFGDSLTAGTGAGKKHSYPAVLSELLGCTVINVGKPGEVTADALPRLKAALEEHTPDLVILCHGGNDFLQKNSDKHVAQELTQMIKRIQKTPADIILIGVPRPGLVLRTSPIYADLARKHDLPCDSKTIPEILSTPSLKADQVHPNAKGYRHLAHAILNLISYSSKN